MNIVQLLIKSIHFELTKDFKYSQIIEGYIS